MSIRHHAAVTAALTVIPLLAALGSGASEADASLLELTSSVRLAQAGPSENPQTLGDPNGPVPVQVAGPVAGTKASRTNSRGRQLLQPPASRGCRHRRYLCPRPWTRDRRMPGRPPATRTPSPAPARTPN